MENMSEFYAYGEKIKKFLFYLYKLEISTCRDKAVVISITNDIHTRKAIS